MNTKKEQVSRTRNYREFYDLLNRMAGEISVDELKETWVSEFTGGRTVSAREMNNTEFAAMLVEMRAKVQAAKNRFEEFDKWRKRVLKSIISMHELNGYHVDNKVAHAKGTALKNMGMTDEMINKSGGANALFNQIKLNDLQTIYNWALRQQKIIQNGNKAVAKDYAKKAIMN